MKKIDILNNVTRTFNKVGFKLKKHSPEILIVTGVVGVVTSAVMACKATTKIKDITEPAKQEIESIRGVLEHPEVVSEEYTPEDAKKDLAIVYTQTGVSLARLYAPSVVLGALSITAILASNNIIRKRNIALAAAYTAVDSSFKEYRGRVIERFGKELDKELKYNLATKTVETTVVNEDGSESKVKETVSVVDPSTIGDFSRIFYEGNPGWDKDPQYTLMYLKQQQNYANEMLKSKGYLFLNDVYELLGFNRVPAGQLIGWIYDEKNPIGDNFIDFGIYDIHDENKIRFVNGDERAIILDFNHDGNILNMI